MDIDAAAMCRRTEELFELYQRCANRKQLKTICVYYLKSLEDTKLHVTGLSAEAHHGEDEHF
ncbi:hypothetical protein OBV_07990 [Oscillibacter valericigenes Sjm18-20]|nr:hypothetical protein OBV_07990 [Oscillibacter valericigenes Sjm18-20]